MLPKIVGGAIILGGLYVVYMYLGGKMFAKKDKPKVGSIPEKPQPQNTSGSTTFANTSTIPSNPSGNYVVKISSGVLNVRQSTDATSKIVGTLKKGTSINANESSIKGWHRLLDDKGILVGYVSSKYIVAK